MRKIKKARRCLAIVLSTVISFGSLHTVPVKAMAYNIFVPCSNSSTYWNSDTGSINSSWLWLSDNKEHNVSSKNIKGVVGDKIYIKPGSYRLSAGEMYGNDISISKPSQWYYYNERGDAYVSTQSYKYGSGMYPASWDYIVFNGLEEGDIVRANASSSGCYFICGRKESAIVDIFKEDVKMNDQRIDVQVGQPITLTGKVTLNGKAQSTVGMKWSSSNTNVANVVNGVVTFKQAGSTTIECTWADSYFSGSAKVNFNVTKNDEPTITSVDVDEHKTATVDAVDKEGMVEFYGWSNANDKTTVNNWQESNVFSNLDSGLYYFFAKDNEGAISKGHKKLIYSLDDIIFELMPPTKNNYGLGEEIDLTDGKLIGHLEFTTETIDIPLVKEMLSEYDNTTDGSKTIDVNYESFKGSFDVTYKGDIKSIQVKDFKESYLTGDEFDKSGIIEIIYTNDYFAEIPLSAADSITGFDSSIGGSCNVTVDYKGFKDTFTVNIDEVKEIDLIVDIENKDVYTTYKKVNIDAKPQENLDYVQLPNGAKVYSKVPIEYLITENGNYTFSGYSKDGVNKDTEHHIITKIDNIPPIITVGYNSKLSKVAINAIDNVAVSKIRMPDGVEYANDKLPLVLDTDGLTAGTIVAYDTAGNVATKDFAFNDFVIGNNHTYVGLSEIPNAWTNCDVPMTISAYSPDTAIDSIIVNPKNNSKASLRNMAEPLDNTDGYLNNLKYNITANGAYEYVVSNVFGEYKENFTVSCIDKVAPTIGVSESIEAFVFQVSDDLSGIKYIKYPDGSAKLMETDEQGVSTPISLEIQKNLLADGVHTISTVDYAGNETITTFTVKNGSIENKEDINNSEFTINFVNEHRDVLFSNAVVSVKENGNYPAINIDNSLIPKNFVVKGWSENKDGSGKIYGIGESIENIVSDMTLYLQIEEKEGHIVTLSNNGFETSEKKFNVKDGESFVFPNGDSIEGKVFKGYAETSNGKVKYCSGASIIVNEDATFYMMYDIEQDNGGDSDNGSGDNSNNGGDSGNGSGDNSNNGGDSDNGSGDDSNNGSGDNSNDGGDSDNGSGDNSNNGGDSGNGSGDDSNNGSDSGNGSGDNSNNGGDSGNGSGDNSNNGGDSGNGSGDNSNNGGDSGNGSEDNFNNGSDSDKDSSDKDAWILPDKNYNGSSSVDIILPEVGNGNINVNINGKSLAKKDYTIRKKKLTLRESALKKLKVGKNKVVIVIGGIEYKFTLNVPSSKIESGVPYMKTEKTIIAGSKFPVYLNNKDTIKSVKWTSSNSKVARVSKNGVITGVKNGKATIKCIVKNKKNNLYKFEIAVKVINHSGKTLSVNVPKKVANSAFPVFVMDKNIIKGKSVGMKISSLSKNAKVTYSSANKQIASVSKGRIVGKKLGRTDITVKVKQNGQVYLYKLKVHVVN